MRTFPLMVQEVEDVGEWFGYLRGRKDTDIHSHVGGVIEKQCYTDGDHVEQGQMLFQIENSAYKAELAMAEANLDAALANVSFAEAALEQAKSDGARIFKLSEVKGAVAEKDVVNAKNRIEAAEAELQAAEAAVLQCRAAKTKAEIDLDYTTVRAPFSGIIGTARVSPGELVTSATTLANITEIDPIRLEFAVNSENTIRTFRKYGEPGHNEGSTLPDMPEVSLVLEDGSTFHEKGTLVAMESKVSNSGLINVAGEVPNPDGLLRSGMAVRARLPLQKKEALLVPAEAIRSVLRNDFIIVVDKANEPHMVPVAVKGRYPVEVREANGYHSVQELCAVEGLHTPLPDTLRGFGYAAPEEAPVVVDEQNAMVAMNISAANSRLTPGSSAPRGKITPVAFTFRPAMQAAVAAAAGAGAQPGKSAAAAKPTMPKYPVKVMDLMRRDVEGTDEWFGTLRGVDEVEVRPQVTGFLKEQLCRDGAQVKEGDVLFTIEAAPFEAAVAEAEGSLGAAQAAVAQAEANHRIALDELTRYQKLAQDNARAVTAKMLQDAGSAEKEKRATLEKARANVKQAEAALRMARINLGYTTIRAPFSGRVGIHKVSTGALVSPADAEPLITLSSTNPMRVDFQVSGRGALQGIEAFETHPHEQLPPFTLILEDGSVYPAQGHVVSADNALSRSTGTLSVVGRVDNVDGILRSGMPVRVRAGMNPAKGAYLVPARAPLNAQGRDVIILLRPDGSPEMLPITKGDLVNIAVANGEGGKSVVQPMQIVEVDRKLVEAMLLDSTKMPTAEDVLFKMSGAAGWQQQALHEAQVGSYRELLEKRAGHALPDSAPAAAHVDNWEMLALKTYRVGTYRDLALHLAGARDELDLIAQAEGYADVMDMALRKLGFEDTGHVPVVVEGTLRAAQVYGANSQAGSRVNTLEPRPFLYTQPRTVVDSVTAETDEPSSPATAPAE